MTGEDGCWRNAAAAWLAANPRHRRATGLPQEPYSLRKDGSGSMHGVQVVGGIFCNPSQKG